MIAYITDVYAAPLICWFVAFVLAMMFKDLFAALQDSELYVDELLLRVALLACGLYVLFTASR